VGVDFRPDETWLLKPACLSELRLSLDASIKKRGLLKVKTRQATRLEKDWTTTRAIEKACDLAFPVITNRVMNLVVLVDCARE